VVSSKRSVEARVLTRREFCGWGQPPLQPPSIVVLDPIDLRSGQTPKRAYKGDLLFVGQFAKPRRLAKGACHQAATDLGYRAGHSGNSIASGLDLIWPGQCVHISGG
jgi:hypothetical protein